MRTSKSSSRDRHAGAADELDRTAFGQLLAEHVSLIFSLAFARLSSREAAEALTLDVAIRAWINRQDASGATSPVHWLITLARIQAEDWRMRGQLCSPLQGFLRLGADAGDADVASAQSLLSIEEQKSLEEQRRLLERQLRAMSLETREVLLLRQVDHLEVDGIAAVLEMSAREVECHLKSAREVLLAGPRFSMPAEKLLGAPTGLMVRVLAGLDASESLPDFMRETLLTAGTADPPARTKPIIMPGAPMDFLKLPVRLVIAFLIYLFRPIARLLSPRGVALLLVVAGLGWFTLFLAVQSGWVPPDIVPFQGPRPPASLLSVKPRAYYYGHPHRKEVNRRAELAIAANEASGKLAAYIPKDYGVLVAVTFADGRAWLADQFISKAEGGGFVEFIEQAPESRALGMMKKDNKPFTAWFLVTF